jgi:hypothetical protein
VSVPADPGGDAALIGWAGEHTPGPQLVWAVEGTRSHGVGLVRALRAVGQVVIEAGRPSRVSRRPGGKSDPADARRAARDALAVSTPAQPRQDGVREALRILLLARSPMSTGSMALLRYTPLRILLFLVVAALLWIVGVRGFWLLLLAIFVSGVASVFVLSRSRDAASASLANRVSHVRRRMNERTAAEDAWDEQRRAGPTVGTRTPSPGTSSRRRPHEFGQVAGGPARRRWSTLS